jgi:protein KRI1
VKLEKIREAAGITGKSVKVEEWQDLIEGDWEDDEWDREMAGRFDNQYYDEQEGQDSEHDDLEKANGKSKTKVRKPKWDDDIDIKDLVPDFEDEDDRQNMKLSDSEEEPSSKKAKSKSKSQLRADAKATARRDRRIIEAMAEQAIPLDSELGASSKDFVPFRYRETSPIDFGLTALDILAADDAQLNQYAGLKKLAAFRDPTRKQKDRKKLGKKARLRQWRKETFGREDGPDPEIFAAQDAQAGTADDQNGEEVRTKKKKKRSRKNKAAGAEVED